MESLCSFELEHYPFDSQYCQIVLDNEGNAREIIKLIAKNLTYIGPKTIKQNKIDLVKFEPNKDNKIKISIKLSRNMLRELFTIIFPTVLIAFVSICIIIY